jgi:filamentous hemagglutinin
MLMSLAVPLMLLSAWMSTPAALMLLFTNIASNLTANNLTIETTKEDINITGSNIDAQQQLSLNSAKDINIKAGYNGSLNETYHKTSSFSLGGLVGIGSIVPSTSARLTSTFLCLE